MIYLQLNSVDFLIEQIENGPISGLIMPNIKQCMQLVNRDLYIHHKIVQSTLDSYIKQ